MNKLQYVTLLVALAGATVAMAQEKAVPATKPAVRAVNITPQLKSKTDLVIDAVDWAYAAPRRADPDNALVLESPRLRITLRNAGTERWASSGRVVAVVRLGMPDELDGRASDARRRGRDGASVVAERPKAGSASVLVNAFSVQPFSGGAPIPGSLAPGEKRTVEIKLEGKNKNTDARKHLMMERDKYYTARVDIQAKGDDQLKNNGADLVFRLDGRGQAVGPTFKQRDTDPAKRGTVGVQAPPGR